jgi:ferredoxin-NADP reductase
MRVARLVHETDLVTSVYLRPTSGRPLPAPLPGQYLTLRAATADPAPVRNYSLSAATADDYRISVKREPKGVVSTYIATALALGDQLDVAAPRGEFVLGDGDAPVVLMSAGIGVTPVLAMLRALADQHGRRAVWWLHTTQGSATHALADEARRLLAALPTAQSRIYYTAGPAHRRLDRDALAQLGLPVDAEVYLCGPAGFMDAMTAALTDLGLSAGRIHTERFTSLTAINPGVVAAARPAPHAPAVQGTGPMITFSRAGLTVAFDEERPSLLEMAEACDVPTRWSCRTGVCHTCTTPLLSGAVEYAPPPLTEPDPGHVLLCCARPRSDLVLDL